MNRLMGFFNGKTVLAVLLISVMWLLYFFTDFKLPKPGEGEGYTVPVVIYFSVLASALGGLLFASQFCYSMMTKPQRVILAVILTAAVGYFLYTVGGPQKNFLQSDVSILCIFTAFPVLMIWFFGLFSPKDKDWEDQMARLSGSNEAPASPAVNAN